MTDSYRFSIVPFVSRSTTSVAGAAKAWLTCARGAALLAVVLSSAIAADPARAQSSGTAAHSSCECATLTLSKPVPLGADRTLLVSVAMIAGSENLTSVSYNGSAMTQIGSAEHTGNARVYLYEQKLGTGAAISANVVVSRGSSAKMVVGAQDFTGVNQTQMLTATGASGKSQTASVIRPGVENGQVVVDAIAMKSVPSPSLTVGTGQTLLWSQNQSSNGTGAQSFKPHSGATGSVTVSYNKGSGNQNEWAMLATTLTAAGTPALSVTKSTNATFTAAGQSLAYTFTVKNTGSVAVSNVSLSDPLVSGSPIAGCAASSLAPDAQTTCTGSYTTTQADVDAGQVVNTATATSTQTGAVSSNTVTVPFTGTATKTLGVTKSTTSTFTAVGQSLTYSFAVQNTGTVTLSNISLSDPLVSSTPLAGCAAATLAPGAQTTCSGTYTTTQTDVDSGQVVNIATATSTETGAVSSNTVTLPFTGTATKTLGVTKSTTSTFTAVGQSLTYSFAVQNTGTVTLSNISLSDPLVSSTPIAGCAAATLAPGAQTTCSATYTTTQADVDDGQVVNTAAATSTETGAVSSNTVTLPFTGTVTKALKVTKSSTSSFTAVGVTLAFNFTVVNTGNVTLTNISLSDPLVSGSPIAGCAATSLAPGAQTTCADTYTTVQADVDAGQVVNTATATSTETGAVSSNTVTLAFAGVVGPALNVVKSTTSTFTAAGGVLSYEFLVQNTGNITLTDVSLSDPLVSDGPIAACAAASLAPGAQTTCSATYTATQADVDAGQIVNTAKATSTETGPVSSNTLTLTFSGGGGPKLRVLKSSSSPFKAAGATLTYEFVVQNTGNVTLTNVSLSDPLVSDAPIAACAAASLAPGAQTACTGTYTTTSEDVAAGQVINVATAKSTQTGAVSSESVTTMFTGGEPALSVVKGTASVFTAAGAPIVYTFTVENTGSMSLTNVSLSDPLVSDSPVAGCAAASLAPGAKTTCSGTYTTTQADVDAGQVVNKAVATSSQTGAVDSNTLVLPFTGTVIRSLTVVLRSDSVFSGAGVPLTYDVAVTNTGNVTLMDIGVSASLTSDPIAGCAAASLAPGATATCSAVYTATQHDVDAGQVVNAATAVSDQTGSVASNIVALPLTSAALPTVNPSLTVSVTSSSTTAVPGAVLTYEFVVENTGDVPLSHVSLTTSMSSAPVSGCSVASLAPGEKVICTATYTVSDADLHAGRLEHVATATSSETGAVSSSALAVLVVLDEQKVRETFEQASQAFIWNRLNGILMSEPESYRLINRGGGGAGGPLALTGAGDLSAMNLAWGTSLQRIRQSAARYGRTDDQAGSYRPDGLSAGGARFDVWVEGTYYRHRRTLASGLERGAVALAYTGFDYRLREHVIVGVLTQFDWSSSAARGLDRQEEAVRGFGWMAGPYVSTRLSGGLLLDVRGAWGRSENDLSAQVSGIDFDSTFTTSRRLVRATLSGETNVDRLRIRPSASFAVMEDAQRDYLARSTRGGVMVDGHSLALGRMMAGPELSYRFAQRGGGHIEPFFTPSLVWDVQRDGTAFDPSRSAETRRGAFATGARFMLKRSMMGDAVLGVDGIGERGFGATSLSARFVIPF